MATGTVETIPFATRRRLTAAAFIPAWIAIGTVTLVHALGGSIPQPLQWVPLAASVVLLGLPHGAVDHLALPRLYDEELTLRWIAVVTGIYAALGGLYAVLWFLAPAAAFVLFILITLLHWGQGELYPLIELRQSKHLNTRPLRYGTLLARGALPMLVPLVGFPDQYQFVAETLIGLYDQAAVATLAPVFTAEARRLLTVGLAVLFGSVLGAGGLIAVRHDAVTPWLIDAGETLLLIVFFLSVPPILAIGIYFCFWHALRHIVRLLALDSAARDALQQGRSITATWRFVRDAAPLTAVSIGLLAVLYAVSPGTITTPAEWIGLYLVLIAILTLPHVVVVSWMDYEQRLLP